MVPALLAAGAIIAVRAVLGFRFPVPWPDETGFVAPAYALAHTGTMFDAGMNPDRLVMWMPPGYMVLLAAIFDCFGYSFALVRWLSAGFMLGALAICATLLRGAPGLWRGNLLACALGMAFLSPYILIDANIGRMEAFFCFVMLLSLLACVHERPYIAAALVCAGAVIHFNAVYFAPPVALLALRQLVQRQLKPPGRADVLACLAASLAIGFYVRLVMANWVGFQDDMAFQFSAKRFFGMNDPAHPLWPVLGGAGIATCGIACLGELAAGALTALYGIGFLLMAHNGHELWYDYGQPLGCLLIAIGVMPAASHRAANLAGSGASIGAVVLLAVLAFRVTPSMAPLLPSTDMLHRAFVPAGEIEKIRRFISTLQPGETVDFGWSGMELFFLNDLSRAGAHWTILRHSVTQVWPLRRPDWTVRCDSSELPGYLLKFDITHARAGRDTGCAIFTQ